MAQGLIDLGHAQDEDLDKASQYSIVKDKRNKDMNSTERENWFFRFIGFQFQLHPPLYWRIISLLKKQQSWKSVKKDWMKSRVTESVPDFFFKQRKAK